MATVFALGSNGSGQLGIGHKEDVSVPQQVLFRPDSPHSPITKIAAGGNHTLLRTRSGELYWSGDASSSACGLVVTTGSDAPARAGPWFQKVVLGSGVANDPQSPIQLVAATWEGTVFTKLDDERRNTQVYALGSGAKGELGLGLGVAQAETATQIPGFPPPGTEVTDLAACMGHVVTVLSNGDVFGWGNGRKGQIGAPEGVVHQPRKINGVGFKVARAVCGKDFTCLVGAPDNGQVLVLGSDKFGVVSTAPAILPDWKDIGAGWGSVFVLRADGSLLSWGRNDHGQMAPPNPLKISHIAVGSEHSLALTENGDVLAWGWGEHGNCGPQVDKDGNVKARWNVIASSKYIPPASKITGIGAGCATSWIGIDSPS